MDIKLTREEHQMVKDAFVKSMWNYRTEHNKMIRALFIEVLYAADFLIRN